MAGDPRHRTRSNPVPSPAPKPQPPKSENHGCVALVVIAVLIAIVAQCTGNKGGTPSGGTQTPDASAAQSAIETAVSVQSPPPVQSLRTASVRLGQNHLKLATVEGLPGEMIYSQNCYDALGRHFSWSKLDICGAFDAQAVAALGDDAETGFDKEVAWFNSETAAGRYLKAATAAGLSADDADARLGSLQAQATPHPRPTQSSKARSDGSQ